MINESTSFTRARYNNVSLVMFATASISGAISHTWDYVFFKTPNSKYLTSAHNSFRTVCAADMNELCF